METATKVKKWGNSLAVRLPKAVALRYRLKEGVEILFSPSGRGVVLQIKKPKVPSLEELVRGITTKNRHKEISWGKKRGREVW